MTSVEENIKTLRGLEGWGLIVGMTPALIIGPKVFKTDCYSTISMIGAALALKKIGLL